jgi:hypothetical protein
VSEHRSQATTSCRLWGAKVKALSPVHVRNFYREKLDEGLSSATA